MQELTLETVGEWERNHAAIVSNDEDISEADVERYQAAHAALLAFARERLTTEACAWRCAQCQRDGLPTVDCPRCGSVGGTGCVYACEHCGHTFEPTSAAEPSREGL